MAKNTISQYSKTNSSNTDVQSVSIAEGMAPSDVNNAMREIMVDLAELYDGTQSLNHLKLQGTTPTLTIGDAGEEDTKIVFDGHAQDYYIGLDDTDDDLKIGLGSAVGTTAHIVIDETGAVTKPLQPCVLAKVASKQSNVGGSDQQTDIPFATEIFDQNSDYSSPSFTAPVTGRYLMIAEVTCGQLDTDATFYQLYAVASNRTHYFSALATDRLISSDGSMSMGCAQIIDMDASDTLKIQLAQSDGATQTDIEAESYFSICLLA